MEKLYFKEKNHVYYLLIKNLFLIILSKVTFNLKDNIVSRDSNNQYVFTGLQILDETVFNQTKEKVFSMNKIWMS